VNLETKITRDLKAGQCTLKNLCDNVEASIAAVTVTLVRMARDGKVFTTELESGITVWKLARDN